jgi:hypothetical protein
MAAGWLGIGTAGRPTSIESVADVRPESPADFVGMRRRSYPAYLSLAVRHLGSQVVLKKAYGPTQGLIIINANYVQWFAVQMTAANEFDPIIWQFVAPRQPVRTGGACFVS